MSILPDSNSSVATIGVPDRGPAFNREELVQRCLNRLALAERILKRFQDEFPEDIRRLGELAAKGNDEEFRFVAHRLKGAAANVAAPGLCQHFAFLEKVDSQDIAAEAEGTLQAIAYEWIRFQSEVRSLLDDA